MLNKHHRHIYIINIKSHLELSRTGISWAATPRTHFSWRHVRNLVSANCTKISAEVCCCCWKRTNSEDRRTAEVQKQTYITGHCQLQLIYLFASFALSQNRSIYRTHQPSVKSINHKQCRCFKEERRKMPTR